MDIGRFQLPGTGVEGIGVNHGATQPESRDDAAARRQLIQAVKAINGAELFGQDSELTFSFDRFAHKPVVRVVDKNTREVVMQIPAEQVLQMAREHSMSGR